VPKSAKQNSPQVQTDPIARASSEVLVQHFKDYREYLSEIYRRTKSYAQQYSYLSFAQDLGFSPTNVIRLTIAGKRDLAEKSARRIARALGLKEADRLYFLELVRHQASRSLSRRKSSARELANLQQAMTHDDHTKAAIEYFGRWYHPVIREFIKREDGIRSADEIVGRIFPKISASEAEDALNLLLRLKYIEFDPKTKIYRVNNDVPTIVPSQAIANHFAAIQFHREMLDVASQAVDQLSESRREINAMTLILSDENFELLRYRIRDFCQKALELERVSQAKGNIVQFNSQLLNLSPSDENDSSDLPASSTRKEVL
jgi:uncharacterized protein (TIGR02147 family)